MSTQQIDSFLNAPARDRDEIDRFLDRGSRDDIDGFLTADSRVARRAPRDYSEDSWLDLARRVTQNVPKMFQRQGAGAGRQILESIGPGTVPIPASVIDADANLSARRDQMREELGREPSSYEVIYAAQRDATATAVEPLEDAFNEATRDLAENAPNVDPNSAKGFAYDIAQATVNMIPAVAASFVTRNPATGMSIIGAQVSGDRFGESRAEGRSVGESNQDAAIFALAEAIPEKIPLGILMRRGGSFMSRTLRAAGAEGVQEMFTEAIQSGYSSGVLEEDMTFGQALDNIVRAGIVGTGVGGTLAIGTAPFARDEAPAPPPPSDASPSPDGPVVPDGAVAASLILPEAIDPIVQPGERSLARDRIAPPTPEDEASPIPTDLIQEGRAVQEDSLGATTANQILEGAGLPSIDTPVRFFSTNGQIVEAVIADASEGARGLAVELQLPDGAGAVTVAAPDIAQRIVPLPATPTVPSPAVTPPSPDIQSVLPEPVETAAVPEIAEPRTDAEVSRRISTAGGQQIDASFEVVEAADLVTSDSLAFDPNLQPRQRSTRLASDSQISDIVANFDPSRLTESAEADRGAPIVGPDNLVESGNGRVQAIRRVFSERPDAAQAYRDQIEAMGLSTDGVQQPVLIRRRTSDLTPEARRQFAVGANESATATMSPSERALADADVIDDAVLSLYAEGADVSAAANREFVRAFISRVPASQRNALVGADGALSSVGVRRVQGALLARAFGTEDTTVTTIDRILESTDDNVRSITGALIDVAPEYARLRASIDDGRVPPEMDISPEVVAAVETVSRLRAERRSPAEYLQQQGMFGDVSPVEQELIRAFFSDDALNRAAGRQSVAQVLRYYAQEAGNNRVDQGSLLDEPGPQAQEVLRAGLERRNDASGRAPTQQAGLLTASGAVARPPEVGPEPGSGDAAPALGAAGPAAESDGPQPPPVTLTPQEEVEAYAEMGIVIDPSGVPYPTPKAAEAAAKARGLTDLVPEEIEGGYGLAVPDQTPMLAEGEATPVDVSESIAAPARTIDETVSLKDGPFISQEEADRRFAEWKAEAQRIGREEDHSNEVILSLFDASGVFTQPYREMGYRVVQIDMNVRNEDADIAFEDDILMGLSPGVVFSHPEVEGKKIVGVIAQPPCTSFAGSGARWWKTKHDATDEHGGAWLARTFGTKALNYFESTVDFNRWLVAMTGLYVDTARSLGNLGFHVIENPIGRIERETGLPKPRLRFNPNHYGETYTKKTSFYGDFNADLPQAPVDPVEGSKMQNKLRSSDEAGSGARSVTPERVAYAFAMANAPGANVQLGDGTSQIDSFLDAPVEAAAPQSANTPPATAPAADDRVATAQGESAPIEDFVEEISGGRNRKTERGTALYDREISDGATGSAVEEVSTWIADEVLTWSDGPDVKVVQSWEELPDHLRSQVESAEAYDIRGVFDSENGPVVYLIADQIATVDDAKRVLAHEAIGHYGMRRSLGEEFETVVRQVRFLARSNPRIREIADEVRDLYRDADGAAPPEDLVAEEVIARLAESEIASPIMDRVKTAIRRFLRSLGFRIEFSETELNAMIANAARGLRTGRRAPSEPQGPRFAREAELEEADSAVQGGSARFSRGGEQLRQSLEAGQDPTQEGAAEERKRSMTIGAALGQPLDQVLRIPWAMSGALDEQGRWRAGVRLTEGAKRIIGETRFNEEGRFSWMNPMLENVRAGMVDRYGLSEEYVERDRVRQLQEAATLRELQSILTSLRDEEFGVEQARVLQAVLTGEAVADADMSALAEPIRNAIDQMGQEAVDLGLISAEAYERNRGTYLHRVYEKYEVQNGKMEAAVQSYQANRRRKIMGSQFKGRGMWIQVRPGTLMRNAEGFDAGERGMPKKGDRFVVLDLMAGQGSVEGVETDGREKSLDRVFLPEGQAVPERYAGYREQGVWEVRGNDKGDVVLWRDFTRKERDQMGEILDARYTIAKTYMKMAQDLSTGRFFADIAKNEEWARGDEPRSGTWREASQYRRSWNDPAIEWVRVPDERIKDSSAKRYGALSGMFVRAEIWRDMNELDRLQDRNLWDNVLTQWKKNKTGRSPVVHMNNVLSNVFLMDMADITAVDLVAGLRSYVTKDTHYRAAERNGAFGADMVSQELQTDFLRPLLREIELDSEKVAGDADTMRLLSRFAEGVWGGIRSIDDTMLAAYQAEDQIFRMAMYRASVRKGMSPEQAALESRDQFLNYDIRAPWANAARRSVMPFLSYTYRAVPVVARSLAHRPWKLAKYWGIAYLANELAYELSGGDEDEERRSLRDVEQGNTWLGTPRMLRMPYNDDYGNPVFLDMRRWVPVGDVFDLNQGSTPIPVPAWMQISGPIALAAEFHTGRSAFTGRDIVNDRSSDWWDRASGVADWAWKSWVPSGAYIPGSWYWSKIGDAATGGRDSAGNPLSLGSAIASSIGVKLKPQDVDQNFYWKGVEFDRIEQDHRAELRRHARDLERGLLSQRDHDRRVARVYAKLETLAENRAETFTPAASR